MNTYKMANNEKRTLYIFDFDDTLVNNHPVDFKSFETIIKKHGLKGITQDRLLELRKKGLLAQDIFSQLTKEPVEKFVAERKKLLEEESIWRHLKLNPGVVWALDRIKNDMNPIIIITRKSKGLVKKILSNLNIDNYIDKIYTAKDKEFLVSKLIEDNPGCEIVFISDSEEDLIPLKKLNVKTYCFYNKYKNLAKMSKITKVIHSMKEIL